jgi:hypothetical protein
MWIEHHVAQSEDPALADSYENCFYSCRFCNQARSNTPRRAGSRRLLEPCAVPWGTHFTQHEEFLNPRDPDAEYTEQVYDLNEPRRLTLRRARAGRLAEAFRVLRELPRRVSKLTQVAGMLSPEQGQELLDAAEDSRRLVEKAHQQLRRYRAIPVSASARCRCGTQDQCTLPAFLATQLLSVPDGG